MASARQSRFEIENDMYLVYNDPCQSYICYSPPHRDCSYNYRIWHRSWYQGYKLVTYCMTGLSSYNVWFQTQEEMVENFKSEYSGICAELVNYARPPELVVRWKNRRNPENMETWRVHIFHKDIISDLEQWSRY